MKRWLRPVIGLFVIVGIIYVFAGQYLAAFDTPDPYSGQARINGVMQLDVAVTPPISTPGDMVTVHLRLRNQMKATVSPEVIIQLPPQLRFDPNAMPTGTTMNLQTNGLNWLPILPANGGERQIEIDFRVETADVAQPDQDVTVVLRHEGQEQTVQAPIWVGMPPRVTGIVRPPQVSVGQPFQLQAQVAGSGPYEHIWSLGDGRQITVNDPVVVYPAAGNYPVTVEVANPLTTATFDGLVRVVPQPAAQFTIDDFTPGVGQAVHFRSESGGQTPLVHVWDFGDGTTTSEAEPTHTYSTPGSYDVHLTVQNEYGRSDAFWTVVVGVPPVADMEIDPSAPAGQPLSGQAFGDDTVTVFRWDMGDGNVYEGAQISHVYQGTGDYYVSMTAQNEYGGTEIGQWVHVDPGLLSLYMPLILRGEGVVVLNGEGDPYQLSLDPVALDEPFVMEPMAVPEGSTPAQQLLLYINEARGRFDLEPLNLNPTLSQAAQQHTDDMARYGYTGHTGYDGSFPAERLLWHGYNAGYAGEATAWGFEQPYRAVEFWVNSPSHRRIILNQYATDVGVAFTADFNAPNVWYWTAEFGNANGAAIQPLIRLQMPAAEQEYMISEGVTYSWNWPLPLQAGQQFTLYQLADGRETAVATVTQSQLDTRYTLSMPPSNDWALAGEFSWQVRLEDGGGNSLGTSELRAIRFLPDPNLPTPTPAVTATVVAPTSTPPPTMTPTATPVDDTQPVQPTPLPPPVLITATPQPTP